jgi:hypothetical protein
VTRHVSTHALISLSARFRLIDIGEQFCQGDATILQEALRQQSVAYFRSYHSARLEELKMFLENESWQWCPVKSTFHITQLHVSAAAHTAARSGDAAPASRLSRLSLVLIRQEFRFLRETPSIASDLTASTSFNQRSDFDLFDRYLYTEREHPFDLDQTQATVSSSPSQYSEPNSLDADDTAPNFDDSPVAVRARARHWTDSCAARLVLSRA